MKVKMQETFHVRLFLLSICPYALHLLLFTCPLIVPYPNKNPRTFKGSRNDMEYILSYGYIRPRVSSFAAEPKYRYIS